MSVALSVAATRFHDASDALEQVEVLDIGRTDNLLQTDELSDRSHLATFHLYEDVLQRLRVETILRRGSSHDTINLTKLVEVANVSTAAEGTQRIEYDCRRHTGTIALGGIDIDLKFWETLRVG